MRMRTWWFMVALLTVVLPVGGCGADSKARLEWGQKVLTGAQDLSAAIDKEVVARQAELAAVIAAMADPNLGPAGAELAGRAEAIRAVIMDKLKYKATIDQTVREMKAWLAAGAQGDPNLPQEIRAWAGMASTGGVAIGQAIGGKTGAWISLIALLLPLLGGLLTGAAGAAVKLWPQLNATRTALQEVVAGGEAFKMEAKSMTVTEPSGSSPESTPRTVNIVDLWKGAQAGRQSKATEKLVALAKVDIKAAPTVRPPQPWPHATV